MTTKQQILLIHGGETFLSHEDYLQYLQAGTVRLGEKKSWSRQYLNRILGDECEIIRPLMPNHKNANYEAWKIFFEKHTPLLNEDIILIGNSLGGVFLAQYLAENKYEKNITALYLVCPPFDDTMPHEDLCNGFKLPQNSDLLKENCSNIKLLFSSDDPVIPITHADKYKNWLPEAELHIFDDKNRHFMVESFPEIIEMLQEDL